MRIKIDKQFINALNKAIEDLGGQSELSRRTGVSQSTINSFINPKKGRLFATETVFNRLMVVIQNYLPENAVNNYNYGNIINSTGTTVTGDRNTVYASPQTSKGVDQSLLLATMQGMTPEEKARFLKEFYAV